MKKFLKKNMEAIDGLNYVPYFLLELSVFLSSRLFIFESINPFSAAVLGSLAYSSAYFAAVPFFLLGVLISGGLMYVHKFLVFAVCMGTANILFKNEKKVSMFKRAVYTGGSLMTANIVDLIVTGVSVVKIIMYIGEVLMCSAGVIMLEGCCDVMLGNGIRKNMSKEQTVSTALLTAVTVAGASTFGEWSVVFTPMAAFIYITFIMSFQNAIDVEEYGEYIKECIKSRLSDFSAAFERLGSAFAQLSQTTVSAEKTVNDAVESVAVKVCEGCVNYVYCWSGNLYNTYCEIDDMFSEFEKSGSISPEKMNGRLKEYCLRKSELCNGISSYSDLINVNIAWEKKNLESRNLIGQQFKNVSELMNHLSDDIIENTYADSDAALFLKAKLIEKKIKVKNITVLKDRDEKREIIINMVPCYGMRKCTKKIIPVINEYLGTKFVRAYNQCVTKNCGGKAVCTLKLTEMQKYRISWYAAKEVKTGSQVSGDNYTMLSMSDGRFMAALSDAMGSGNSASMESAATVELFEDFVNAGFDRNMAVDMINSALVLKSERESFSTLDSVIVNLQNGNTEFIKICAAPTFIKRGENTDMIKSSSLPVGILPSADSHTSVRRLIHNDVLVMVTDGVTDVLGTSELRDFIGEIETANPRIVANTVLEEVKKKSEGVISDDVTVLAMRFWEREE